MSERTIAAISTPKGEGGISVIRISGSEALTVADKCFSSIGGKKLCDMKGYTAAFGAAVRSDGSRIDEAVALVFRAPKSYTGEDVVEISVHGGIVPARECLNSIFAAGAYAAGAGEFTKRAFLNGKMDLAEAESVIEIIGAKNAAALRLANGAKEGRIGKDIERITEKLLLTASSLAAFSDFPDEDIEGLDKEHFSAMIEECEAAVKKLISTFDNGQAVLLGVPAAIVGKPNVGKSTLMNMLSGNERSIVTKHAGTTRDIVETQVNVGDITLVLSDTAGIRETDDEIESIGVSRAVKRLDGSSLVLAVFDTSKPFDGDDGRIIDLIKDKNCIAVLNKSDLPIAADCSALAGFNTVAVSAKLGEGVDTLAKRIEDLCGAAALSADDTVLLNERQYSCAVRAKNAITEAKEAFYAGVTLDAVTVLIDEAIDALLELSGKKATGEVVEEIFKNFCIGK